jgi:hypothetical protein
MRTNGEGTVPRLALVATIVLLCLAGCGGGAISGNGGNAPVGGNAGGGNAAAISVNSGPTGRYLNGVFTNVTVCVPGSSSCQTVGDVLVDTGSSGLRLLNSALQLPLPAESATSGGALLECAQFVDGFTWGPVHMADVKIAGETARNVPVQIIDANSPPAFGVPSSCSNTGMNESTLNNLLANGILGVGNFRQDCGGGCITPGNHFYFACSSSSSCSETNTTLAQQLQNPVWMFAGDNNGVLIQLQSIADQGQASASGSLIFGIGTQPNNGLGNARVLTLDRDGNFTTVFKGTSYPGSFLDTGSSIIFFLTSALTGFPDCGGNLAGVYCPASTQPEAATNQGTNGANNPASFKVANPRNLAGFAVDDIAGSFPTCSKLNPVPCFDFGLPFFFGKNVFTAIEGQDTPAGPGPFVAY